MQQALRGPTSTYIHSHSHTVDPSFNAIVSHLALLVSVKQKTHSIISAIGLIQDESDIHPNRPHWHREGLLLTKCDSRAFISSDGIVTARAPVECDPVPKQSNSFDQLQ